MVAFVKKGNHLRYIGHLALLQSSGDAALNQASVKLNRKTSKGILILSLIAETQIGLGIYAVQLRLPVFNRSWRMNVNHKKKANISMEADQSALFCVP